MPLRLATRADTDIISKTGYDVWGIGTSEAEYLASRAASAKHAQGTWYVFENNAGDVVSALICYQNTFGLPEGAVGIGSVATLPTERGKGYARAMLEDTLRLWEDRGVDTFFLYADDAEALYRSLGFHPLPDTLQKYRPSCGMARTPHDVATLADAPVYF